MTKNQAIGRLLLANNEELFIFNLSDVAYIMADDHYSYIYYTQQSFYMVPFGLSSIMDSISEQTEGFLRVGRKLIINYGCLIHVNINRQALVLRSNNGEKIELHASKQALKELVIQIRDDFSK